MLECLTVEAKEQRRLYKREYRSKNRDKINRQQREWRAKNPELVKQYNERYWERVADKKKVTRASWQYYGINKERYKELTEYIRSGRYTSLVSQAAHRANKDIAEYLLLSVTKNLSYEGLQRLWELREIERMACGRSDFYGYRRLFYHYLNIALKGMQEEAGAETPA